MEKDYLGVSSIMLVSLLLGFVLVLVSNWLNQSTVEEIVPRSAYLVVVIVLLFIDTVAFIFMRLYFIYDRKQFSNRIFGLASLSYLICFIRTVTIIQ